MAGVHPLEDLAPRDVVAAAISRRMAEAPAGVDDHVLPRRDEHRRALLHPVPVDHRGVPGDRHRPGPRPHPGRPGRPLRLRRRAGAPRRHDGDARPVRRRRGGLHRCPRRQPAGLQQPHRGRRRRHPPRPRPRLGAAGPASSPPPTTGRRRRSTPRSAPRSAAPCHATSGWSATPPRWPRPPTSWPRSPASSTGRGRADPRGVGGDQRADRRRGGRRRGGGPHREPRLSPPQRLPDAARRVARTPRRLASTPTGRSR